MRTHECTVRVNPSNTIKLQLYPLLPLPPCIALLSQAAVPVLVKDLDWLDRHCVDEDIVVRELLPYMNGQLTLAAIVDRSGHALHTVRMAVAQLVYFGCVVLVSVFQFSNEYTVCQRRFECLMNDAFMQRQMLAQSFEDCFDLKSSEEIDRVRSETQMSRIDRNRQLIATYKLDATDALHFAMRIMSYMRSGLSVRAICSAVSKHGVGGARANHSIATLTALKDAQLLQIIDMRRLCLFAQMNRIIRRVHVYPKSRSDANGISRCATQSIATHKHSFGSVLSESTKADLEFT